MVLDEQMSFTFDVNPRPAVIFLQFALCYDKSEAARELR